MKVFAATLFVLLAGSVWAQAPSGDKGTEAQPKTGDQPKASAPATTVPTQSAEPAAAAAKIDPVKEADIRRLIDVSGMRTSVTEVMGKMEKDMRPVLSNSLPPGDYREKLLDLFFVKFNEKFDMEKLIDLAVPVYDKYFSDDEIKELAKYYETPIGQKAKSVLPKVMSELQEAGKQSGEKIGRESILEVLDEHPDLKQALEEAAKARQPQ